MATLNIAGDSAGMKKRCSALSIAIRTAAVVTSARNGNMMRVSRIVSSIFPGTLRNPEAYSSHERLGEDDARDDNERRTISRDVDDVEARRQAAALSPDASDRVNVGTSAALRAPSANRSRRTLGRRKAMRKASMASPAPKKYART